MVFDHQKQGTDCETEFRPLHLETTVLSWKQNAAVSLSQHWNWWS